MGDHEDWSPPNGIVPNGLLRNDAAVTRELDLERWSKAEDRAAELIACIQPNKPSEERRNAVADYVRRLVTKCFSCQVFTFGSVPLKTYLPDGDIDLTTFSNNQNLKDTWATEVRDMLKNEEKSENAEFRVKEVQYIQAEVKLVKCLVENIVVDISFNQLGGLCTLCFLEEVDNVINNNHLFKRSIILIKAWCYYESRILGAHHGLISTYALETLVLYIFHVFNNSFVGPLEVLYRFLVFFSNFDWDNFCVSLWGPVPITSLPDMTAEPPRRDNGELMLNKLFLDTCSTVYSVYPGGQENQGQPFISKYFNVVDPLRTNNNLGRSVSRGNFFRIRSAFAFGAKKLARLLECPEHNLIIELNQFFMNTLERHGEGSRPDVPAAPLHLLQPSLPEYVASENSKIHPNSKKKNTNSTGCDSTAEGTQISSASLSQRDYGSSETMSKRDGVDSRTENLRNHSSLTSSKVANQVARSNSSVESAQKERDPKSSRADHLMNEIQGRYQFARTRSSPELTDTSNEVTSRGRRNRIPDGNDQIASKPDNSRRKNLGLDASGTPSTRSSVDEPPSGSHRPFHEGLDAAANLNDPLNNYHTEAGHSLTREELPSFGDLREMHQEEQDLVNMLSSSKLQSLGGQYQMPINFAPHFSMQTPPSVLASMGYPKNLVGMMPTNMPLVGPPWPPRVQFPQNLLSSPLPHHYPPIRLAPNTEEMVESSNEHSDLTDFNQEVQRGFWQDDSDGASSRGVDSDGGGSQMLQVDENNQSTPAGFGFVPFHRMSNHGNSAGRGQPKFAKEIRGFVRDGRNDSLQYQNEGEEVYLSDGRQNLRTVPTLQASTSRSKTSSESSWDASSVKTQKPVKDRRSRRAPLAVTPTVYGKEKNGWQYESVSVDHGSSQADDESSDWVPLTTMDADMEEKTAGSSPAVSPHFRSHKMPNYEHTQISRSDSLMPVAPMLVGPGSRQRPMDNSGAVPFAFYLTGPPVPFLTMLPVYNYPTENGNLESSTSNNERKDVQNNDHINMSEQKFDPAEGLDQSEIFGTSRSTDASVEPSEHNTDILHSDFTSHWQNLQFGRFCQGPRHQGPMISPPPVMVPPVYIQGHFPWEGPGRPVSPNSNIFNQLVSCSPRLVPVAPLQPGSNGPPPNVYQRYNDEIPRYRAGTGTYLPKNALREQQAPTTRSHRGNYNHVRNDHHGDREGNWNNNSRSRISGRGYNRSHVDKFSSRSDRAASNDGLAERSWEPYRHDTFPSHPSQNGPYVSSNSTSNVSANMAYGMYPMPRVNSNGVRPSGPSGPPVFMIYPYENSAGYGPSAEQLEFGTLGPLPVSGANEVSLHEGRSLMRGVYEQHRLRGVSSGHSSPDQPSSPRVQR